MSNQLFRWYRLDVKLPDFKEKSLLSWQLKTTYGNRISANTSKPDIGGIIVADSLLDMIFR